MIQCLKFAFVLFIILFTKLRKIKLHIYKYIISLSMNLLEDYVLNTLCIRIYVLAWGLNKNKNCFSGFDLSSVIVTATGVNKSQLSICVLQPYTDMN